MICLESLVLLMTLFALPKVFCETKIENFIRSVSGPLADLCTPRYYLMPSCESFIPGLYLSTSSVGRPKLLPSTVEIRRRIQGLTQSRFPSRRSGVLRYGLYPYLERTPFTKRQEAVGTMIDQNKPLHVFEIGAYFNPVYLFLQSHCPRTYSILEPILDPLSVRVMCPKGNSGSESTVVNILPLTFHEFSIGRFQKNLQDPDAVICIGCDVKFGPKPDAILQVFKNFTFYLEYATDYLPSSKAFGDMSSSSRAVKELHSQEILFEANTTSLWRRKLQVFKVQ
uniref:Uncharacterized protein n=1 Tax=Tetraselmis sp. GSL018 TaxID=582737 RepID=A0A061SAS8_9CHLO|mmetsp:Transcript_3800/g.9053  ORF Transcript_3800/g.9053 Transcript_3800/m.9053 type:complete len:282 (+) Transcript_3800:162-1007(+)